MKEQIYRCGWCGHPTDKEGKCLPNPVEYIKENEGAEEVLINGECCPNGNNTIEDEHISYSRMMDGEGVHWY